MFLVRWEFEVPPERMAKFVAAYGPAGEWARLFKTAAGYRSTELTQIAPTRWVTVDRWDSRSCYQEFRASQAAAYAAIRRPLRITGDGGAPAWRRRRMTPRHSKRNDSIGSRREAFTAG